MDKLFETLIYSSISNNQTILGVGIDTEEIRPLRYNISKYLINAKDVTVDLTLNQNLLMLWTIKEALYKATINNQNLFLRDFSIISLVGNRGTAFCQKRDSTKYNFQSLFSEQSITTIALRVK